MVKKDKCTITIISKDMSFWRSITSKSARLHWKLKLFEDRRELIRSIEMMRFFIETTFKDLKS